MALRRAPLLQDRDAERDQLRQLLDTARAGESAALVVRGEAGIGKTALLDHVAQQASGFDVARIAGTQSEMELPFAGLHQLCAPMLDQLDALPEPQRDALRVTFGLTSGHVPDRFLVGLVTLSLLSEVALKRPLLCIVDDAQWLDAASGQVLGFVARRILAESVLLFFGFREPSADHHLLGLPDLTLQPLTDEDARALLAATVPGRVDTHVRDRVVAETRGNPLALLELPRGMTAAELAGGFAVATARDLPTQLEQHFSRRLGSLPPASRRLLLLATAEPSGDVSVLWRAARTLGIERDAAVALEDEQLLEIGRHVRFRHPLVRSAIYSGATPADRREAHVALAGAIDPQTDPDRRAWHRALAAAGPDEEVASELEQSARRAQARGGLAAAAAFLERSVALTQDAGRRADRALAAAGTHVQAGAFDAAVQLLATAEIDARNDLQRARIELVRGQMTFAIGSSSEASVQLHGAAKRLEPLDVNLARETYLDAWGAAMYAGPSGLNQLREVSEAARAVAASSDPPRLPDLLLDGFTLLIAEGLMAAAPTLRQAVLRFPSEELSVDKGLQWGALAGGAALLLWDFESVQATYRRQSELARSAGALAPLCFTLVGEAYAMTWRGDLSTAAALAAEADALAETIGFRLPSYGVLYLEALKGDEPRSSTFIQAAIDLATAQGDDFLVELGCWNAAILSNGLGRYELALTQARQASHVSILTLSWVLAELIEAAARTGDDALATDSLERLAERIHATEADWGRGIFSRCQALVSDDETAEEHYREAIDCLARTQLRPDIARAYLLYGEWLRRQNRRIDAREQLRTAHAMFTDIGMLAFAERARRELQATGETVRKRQEETRNDLTPQEEQIAHLAREGRTNPEIGAQLFISARTVEWHLRKIFAKLGIASRRGLRDALPARTDTTWTD
jgi:DNA-binding CsgD family transcriptional regulator